MLGFLLNKSQYYKIISPMLNNIVKIKSFYYNENNKTFNKLVGITMNEQVKKKQKISYNQNQEYNQTTSRTTLEEAQSHNDGKNKANTINKFQSYSNFNKADYTINNSNLSYSNANFDKEQNDFLSDSSLQNDFISNSFYYFKQFMLKKSILYFKKTYK